MGVNIEKVFGENVFDDSVMKVRLPKSDFERVKTLMHEGGEITEDLADVVAQAMKEWALEKGATHYTHVFQPYVISVGAEKHDSFASVPVDGKIENTFTGKELLMGEPDASSFPSGGLRETCGARGYTAWDITSPVYIKEDTLCIPTAFCSYTGESLDTKTPLLKAMHAVSKQGVRLMRLFGNENTKRIYSYVGPEQEYFLVDKEKYLKRPDLIYSGRTLFGAPAPKGQEMDDQYFGAIPPRVKAFMEDIDAKLWKLGITAKTEHCEVAPGQFEIAPIFSISNVALDNNLLVMDILKKTARQHGLICLLHEKPFDGINGSGKHNNWSVSTNTGVNLLDPGKTPAENIQFLVFLVAVIKAVDEYADLMRVSASGAGNDHRLGANEAPPAIVSIFIGDELTEVLKSIEEDKFFSAHKTIQMDIGAHVLPHFTKDTTDRNRTSPFAFTGNKFEFRMLGSSASVAGPNVVLNTAVAEALAQFYKELEGTAPEDMETAVHELIKRAIRKHKKVIFNGNGYTDEWIKEAEERGLYNLVSTPDALPQFIADKNIELFTKHSVFTKEEIYSRYEILLENYVKTINIESKTLQEMLTKDFIPAVNGYAAEVAVNANEKKALIEGLSTTAEESLVKELTEASNILSAKVAELKVVTEKADAAAEEDMQKAAESFHKDVLTLMDEMKDVANSAEEKIPDEELPYPTYDQMLFYV